MILTKLYKIKLKYNKKQPTNGLSSKENIISH